jgi:hypothetical protein
LRRPIYAVGAIVNADPADDDVRATIRVVTVGASGLGLRRESKETNYCEYESGHKPAQAFHRHLLM